MDFGWILFFTDSAKKSTERVKTEDPSRLDDYILLSEGIPGWTRGEEAREFARISFSLPPETCIVEIGSFFGAATILLAGPRRLRGSGVVHCVDPFDCSGDLFSVPHVLYPESELTNTPHEDIRNRYPKRGTAA